jgi:hypothetical protein
MTAKAEKESVDGKIDRIFRYSALFAEYAESALVPAM